MKKPVTQAKIKNHDLDTHCIKITVPIMVEAGGVEPPSENPLSRLSTSVVYLQNFPLRQADKQAVKTVAFYTSIKLQAHLKDVHHSCAPKISRGTQIKDEPQLCSVS